MLSDAAAQPRGGTLEWLYEQCKSTEPVRQDNCSAFLLDVAGAMEILGYTYENPPDGVNKDFVAALGPSTLRKVCSSGRSASNRP